MTKLLTMESRMGNRELREINAFVNVLTWSASLSSVFIWILVKIGPSITLSLSLFLALMKKINSSMNGSLDQRQKRNGRTSFGVLLVFF
jgi:hypothetical protein